MTEDQVHLHNEFLLCLFNKVQGLASVSTVRINKHNSVQQTNTDKEKLLLEKRLRLKRKYKTDKSNFEVSLENEKRIIIVIIKRLFKL